MTDYVSVDLDEIAKVQEKFGRRVRIPTIRINPGEEKLLRILKAPTDRRFFIVRVHHWNIPIGVGKTPPQACAYKHFGRNCYFCEVVNEYYNSGDPRKAELARNMKATISYTSNVIDLGDLTTDEGTPKIQLWTYSESVFKELCFYVKNKEEYGDIFHPTEGRDIRLQSEVVGSAGGTSYTKHKIKVRGNASAVPSEDVFEYLYDLEKERSLREFSYEQQMGIFDKTLDFRSGEVKSLPGNEFGIPKLVAGAPKKGEFESHEVDSEEEKDEFVGPSDEVTDEAAVEEVEEEAAVEEVEEEAAVEEVSDEDEWESALSDEDDSADEKVADIRAKLKATLNKKHKK